MVKVTVVRRETGSLAVEAASILVSVFLALTMGAVLLALMGKDPIATLAGMASGAVGSKLALTETLLKATPLLFTGIAVLVALRAGVWNIGAEGQLVMGGIGTTGAALFWFTNVPEWLILPLVILSSFVAGALWGLIPAALKVTANVNEILATLMLNYVAVKFVEFLYYDSWRNPRGFGFPGTAELPSSAWLPRMSGRLHLGFVFALIIVFLIWLLISKTKFGFELKVMGASYPTARYSGINTGRSILIVMLISGGIAGLAGMSEISGVSHKLQNGLAVGYGFTGIIVAFLARLRPVAVIPAAFIMAGLVVGSDQLQITQSLPAAFADVFQGMVLLSLLASETLVSYRIRFEEARC